MLVYFWLALHLNQGIKYLVGKEWHVNCACDMCGRSRYVTTVDVRNFQNAQFPPNLIPRSYHATVTEPFDRERSEYETNRGK